MDKNVEEIKVWSGNRNALQLFNTPLTELAPVISCIGTASVPEEKSVVHKTTSHSDRVVGLAPVEVQEYCHHAS